MENQGFSQLSTEGLLAVTVTADVARELAARYSTLQELHQATAEELTAVKGLTSSRINKLMASLELGRRYFLVPQETKPKISSPADAARYLMPHLSGLQKEHFISILLDCKNQVIGHEVVSIGCLDSALVHPREVLKTAIRRSAKSILIAHNHPSTVVDPSAEDLALTDRLKAAADLLGIPLVDHLIIGANGRFYSFKEGGHL